MARDRRAGMVLSVVFGLCAAFTSALADANEYIGFQEDYIYTDISGTGFLDTRGGLDYYRTDVLWFRDIQLLQSTDQTTRTLAQYRLFIRPEAEVKSRNSRVALEYGMGPNWSIGYSLENSSMKVDNVPLHLAANMAAEFWFLTLAMDRIRPGTLPLSGLDYPSAVTRPVRIGNLRTVNFESAVHLNFGRIDPYVRFGVGLGSYGSFTTRLGVSAGLRIYVTGSIYIQAERFTSFYRISHPGGGGGGSSSSESEGGGGEGYGLTPVPDKWPAAGMESRGFQAKLVRHQELGSRFGIGYAY